VCGNVAGDPKYKVPSLDPILIEELSVAQGSSNFGLSFLARNATLWGLKNVQVEDIRYEAALPHLRLLSKSQSHTINIFMELNPS
jgi:hypothetical protein